MTGVNITSTWFLNREFAQTDNIFSGDTLFIAPEYEYYKTILVGTWWSTEIIHSYDNPTWWIIWKTDYPIYPVQTWWDAEAFCDILWYTLVSWDWNGSANTDYIYWRAWVRYDVQWWSPAWSFLNITCSESITVEPEILNVVNNKQIYQQLYDIKLLTLILLIMVTFFGFHNILKKYIFTRDQ